MLMTTQKMQLFNVNVVLKTIREAGFISRIEIARKLGCSKSTISLIIAGLEECGLIREVGTWDAAKAGRKSHILTFDGEAVAFLSAHIRRSRGTVGLVDLAGRIVLKDDFDLPSNDPDTTADRLSASFSQMLKNSPIPTDRIEAAGIMCPGFVDWEGGVVNQSVHSLGWDHPVPLASMVSQRLGKPVILENDANAIALAESWIGAAEQYSQFVLLFVGRGIGGAYIHDNRLLRGSADYMAEFGRVPAPGAPGVWIENQIGLKAVADEYGLVGDEEERLSRAAGILFSEESETNRILRRRFIDGLAYLICSIYACLSPQAVVVHCPYRFVPDSLLGELSSIVSKYLGDAQPGLRRIVNSRLTEGRGVIGGAACAISRSRYSFILSIVN